MNPEATCTARMATLEAFNSLYLGFFHESTSRKTSRKARLENSFQFPLLGIFPWIIPPDRGISRDYVRFTFNSLYLGFFHESRFGKEITVHYYPNFQFPLLGIFPWIKRVLRQSCFSFLFLSIPSTWDFSMNPTLFWLNWPIEGCF